MEALARFLAVTAFAALFGANSPAIAALSTTDLMNTEAAPATDAVLPPLLPLQGEQGEARSLRQWLGNTPSIWILADYTCETLCGPLISIVSEALERTGLRPGLDFRLIVVGLDPKDTAADAAAMKDAQVGRESNLDRETFFLRGTAENVSELTKALGFHSVYDSEHDQFAHPAAAYVVTPAGHVARVLSSLGAPRNRLAAGAGPCQPGSHRSWTDHVRLLCYGFDPSRGAYTAAIGRVISGAGALTLIALGLFILALSRREGAPRPE